MTGAHWIEPNWPRWPSVNAGFSLRYPGFSQPPYDALNLGLHVGDEPQAVEQNRQALIQSLGFARQPGWMQQVHGTTVVQAARADQQPADAVYATEPGEVCAVMVADCLPILLRSKQGACVAAIHAGWRGLAAGIIESTLRALADVTEPADLQAWLGPCIGPDAFEVGPEVRDEFLARDAGAHDAFVASESRRYLANLQLLARRRLHACGLRQIWATERCTFTQKEHFFSFRRDGVTGRMAAVIGLQA